MTPSAGGRRRTAPGRQNFIRSMKASNTATALIVTPIALAAAREIGVNVRPLLMTVAVAAAASFLTPIATPANLMVMEPGGYHFNDYWKLGLPMPSCSFP